MDHPKDLTTWLGVQLDDDERIAKRVEPNQAPNQLRAMVTRDGSLPFLVVDSARVLRQVERDRRILDEYAQALDRRKRHPDDLASAGALLTMVRIVKLLARPYADRPGYRSEWAP